MRSRLQGMHPRLLLQHQRRGRAKLAGRAKGPSLDQFRNLAGIMPLGIAPAVPIASSSIDVRCRAVVARRGSEHLDHWVLFDGPRPSIYLATIFLLTLMANCLTLRLVCRASLVWSRLEAGEFWLSTLLSVLALQIFSGLMAKGALILGPWCIAQRLKWARTRSSLRRWCQRIVCRRL